jgi:hypothetical protein
MPPLGVSNSLKNFKNGLEMRKLCANPPSPEGVKNWKKKTHKTL